MRMGSRFTFLRDVEGWKRFAFEVAIVVVGILLAIWLDGMVSDWRTAKQAQYHRKLIESELVNYRIDMLERLNSEPCRVAQVTALHDALMADGGDWPGTVSVLQTAGINPPENTFTPLTLIQTPVRLIRIGSFEAARQAGVLDSFKPSDVVVYQVLYDLSKTQVDWQWQLIERNAKLYRLKLAGPMSEEERRDALADLAEFDQHGRLLAISARQGIDAMDELLPFSLSANTIKNYEQRYEQRKASLMKDYGDCAVFPEHLFDPIEDFNKG